MNFSPAEQTVTAFSALNAVVAEQMVFGVPHGVYFEPAVGAENPVLPAEPFQQNTMIADQTVAQIKAHNAIQSTPTAFGMPYEDFFSQLSDDFIWDLIERELASNQFAMAS